MWGYSIFIVAAIFLWRAGGIIAIIRYTCIMRNRQSENTRANLNEVVGKPEQHVVDDYLRKGA